MFLVIERTALVKRILGKMPAVLLHLYVCVVVVVGWVFFRADSLGQAVAYLGAMVRMGTPPLFNSQIFLTVNAEFLVVLVFAILGAAPLSGYVSHLSESLTARMRSPVGLVGGGMLASISFVYFGFILLYSIASILGGAHNPFLYFRF